MNMKVWIWKETDMVTVWLRVSSRLTVPRLTSDWTERLH